MAADFLPYYHTSDEMFAELKDLTLTCPDLKLTEGAVKSYTYDKPSSAKKIKYMLIFGEHARELISPETGFNMLKCMCGDCAVKSTKVKELVEFMKEHVTLLVVPNVNVGGRKHVESGLYCQRVNNHGVDLNRNWNDHWEHNSRGQETYAGASAFSEVETRALRELAREFKPDSFVTIHSGCLGMYTPYAYSKTIPHAAERANKILQARNAEFCNCHVGSAGKEVGYLCPGTSLDYVFDKLGCRYSFAFEIWDGTHYKNGQAPSFLQQAAHVHKSKASCFLNHEEHAKMLREGSSTKKSLRKLARGRSLAELRAEVEARELGVARSATAGGEGERFVGPQNALQQHCAREFNPLKKEWYDNTVAHWTRALLLVGKDVYEDMQKH